MAFASEVRTEILENLTLRKKFRRAQGYGLLLCSKHFDAGEISMTTERQEIAQLYRATLRDILGKGCEEIPITRTGMGNATRHYAVALSHPASRQKVLEYFGQQGDQINAEMIAREGEAAAFLSGAYLACGSVTDPEKNYLLEFTVYRAGLVEPLAARWNRWWECPSSSFAGTRRCCTTGKVRTLKTPSPPRAHPSQLWS